MASPRLALERSSSKPGAVSAEDLPGVESRGDGLSVRESLESVVMSGSSGRLGGGGRGDADVARAPCGDQLDDLAVVGVLALEIGGDAAEVERGDAVGDLEHVDHVVRDEHDAEALIGQPA